MCNPHCFIKFSISRPAAQIIVGSEFKKSHYQFITEVALPYQSESEWTTPIDIDNSSITLSNKYNQTQLISYQNISVDSDLVFNKDCNNHQFLEHEHPAIADSGKPSKAK